MRVTGLAGLLLLTVALGAPEPGRATAPASRPRDLDLVFVLDTTGSMAQEIREVKERVQQLALALGKARPGAEVRIGVVAYRDRGDEYLTQVSPLSADVKPSFDFLAGLRADGGGDAPEDVLAGLAAALRQIEWRPAAEVDRQVFLIGDAPPQLDYPDGPRPEELLREAAERTIVLNTIGCRSLPPDGVGFFRRIAYATEGSYQHIGRVEAEGTADGGVARAVLAALDVDAGAEGAAREAIGISPMEGVASGGRDLLAEHVPPCGLRINVPPGLGLDPGDDPRVSRAADGLRVEVRLVPGQGGGRTYRLESCVPPSTPIHVLMEEVR